MPMADGSPYDPTEHGRWRQLRLLQAAMDADIARIYAEAQISELKPSFVMELLRLNARGPMTITELARSVQLTHSAVSQKVAAMRAAGWVRTTTGADARSKKVALTAKARASPAAGRRMAGHRGRAGGTGDRDPVPAQPGRRRHRGGAAAEELPRPDRREARHRPFMEVRRAPP